MEEKTEKLYKEDTHRHMPLQATVVYAILQLGKKYHTVGETSGFQAHMLREKTVINADKSKEYLNEILRGDNDVVKTLEHHISDCEKWRKNQVIARELLLTASKKFFDGLSEEDLQVWISANVEFLQKEYAHNLLFCVLHRDEQAPHLHVLVGVKQYDHNKQIWKQQCYKYFDGREKLRELQTRYAEHMQKYFPVLQRGAMYQKCEHNKIQRIYGILEGDNLTMTEGEAKTKLQLLDIKMKRLEGTIENLRTINSRLIIENSELIDENKSLKEESIFVNKAIKDMMIRQHIPMKEWDLSKANTRVETKSQEKKIGS